MSVQDSFEYRADLSDSFHLASEYLHWIATLINHAKKTNDKTLLDIAEYIAQSQADDFLTQAKAFV